MIIMIENASSKKIKIDLKNFRYTKKHDLNSSNQLYSAFKFNKEIFPTAFYLKSKMCFIRRWTNMSVTKIKLATIVEGDLKAPFSLATTLRCIGGWYIFSGLLHFTLDAYLIILSVKQGSIKYHFLSL